jgi:hypothetical protein
MIISKQILPLRLSAPPLNLGETDFNKQNCSLLSLYISTPSLSGWPCRSLRKGWGAYITKKNRLLMITDTHFLYCFNHMVVRDNTLPDFYRKVQLHSLLLFYNHFVSKNPAGLSFVFMPIG